MVRAMTEPDQTPFASVLHSWTDETERIGYNDYSGAAKAHSWGHPPEPQFVAPDDPIAQLNSAWEDASTQDREHKNVSASAEGVSPEKGTKSVSRQARRKRGRTLLRNITLAENDITSLPRMSDGSIRKRSSSRADVVRQRNMKRPHLRG